MSGIDGYVLRSLSNDDRKYFLDCMKETVLDSVTVDEKEMSDLWIDLIGETISSNLDGKMKTEAFILKTDSGKNAGILWMGESRDQYTCDTTGYVLGVFVEEELRGKGLGRFLMAEAEDWCRQKGLLSITLNVSPHNRSARGLYDNMGFFERSTVMRKDIPRKQD